MTTERRSYQSIEQQQAVEPSEATCLISNHEETVVTRSISRRPKSFVFFKSSTSLATLTLLCAVIVLAVPFIPTREELELAQEYNVPGIGATRKIRAAQQLADSSRQAFLGGDADLKGLFKKISEKNGAKDYMEPPDGCEASVIIVRHCEKGSIREHCAYIGYERSVYLTSLFGDNDERWPSPSFIFAEGPGARKNKKKMNFREIETVGPIAEKAGVKVDDRCVILFEEFHVLVF